MTHFLIFLAGIATPFIALAVLMYGPWSAKDDGVISVTPGSNAAPACICMNGKDRHAVCPTCGYM